MFDPVPKRDGGVRWITRLDPADEAAYRAAVTPLVGRIERALGPEVLASRARRSAGGWRLEPWRPARTAWAETIRTALATAPRGTAFLLADVRECYASISAETVAALLGPEAAHAVALLRRFRERGVRGLPVGPEPSAVLANAALARLDAALRSAGVRHVRWVDDVVAWGDRARILDALRALHRSARSIHLALHDGKSSVLDGGDGVRDAVLRRRPSPVPGRSTGIIAAP